MSRPKLKAVPSSSVHFHTVALLEHQMERTGVLLLAAQAMLRELGDNSHEDDRERIAKLLDMAMEESQRMAALNLLRGQS